MKEATAREQTPVGILYCAYCKGEFTPKRASQKFCTDKCNKTFHKQEEVKRAALDLFMRAVETILSGKVKP